METVAKKDFRFLNGSTLKLLAMLFMLLDHMWATVMPGNPLWMTCVGRLAFPIFAFQIAEGYVYTKNFKRYLLRMFLFALVSEIPYNMMCTGYWIDPFGQNVMFTFCWGLIFIRLIDKAWKKNTVLGLVVAAAAALLGYFAGTFTFVDYHGEGVLMVLAFWLCRKLPGFWGWLAALAAMIYINCIMISGQVLHFSLFGNSLSFPVQGFAVLSMIFIGLYNGKRGLTSKGFQYFGYAFYPVHILVLSLIAMFLL